MMAVTCRSSGPTSPGGAGAVPELEQLRELTSPALPGAHCPFIIPARASQDVLSEPSEALEGHPRQ